MRKLFCCILLVLTALLCLSGCYPMKDMYKPEDADRTSAEGSRMMQAWLEENMPDAQLDECTAYVAWTHYDGNNYLTDYASGQISHDGKQTAFSINTVTGAVYFEMDDDTRRELDEIVESYYYEAMEKIGIIPESVEDGYAFECHVMAPAKDGDSATEVPWVYSFDFGLPAGTENLEAFVRNPQTRMPICISGPEMTVSDTTDLSAYDLSGIERLENEYGLHISLYLTNSNQRFQKSTQKGAIEAELWEYGYWLDADGLKLWGRVRERKEMRNVETDALTVSDVRFNPETDLFFEKTDYGYRLSLTNKELADSLTVIANEGAEILEYEYYRLDEDDYAPNTDLAEKGDETFWEKQEDGSYVLVYGPEVSTLWLYDGDILVRKE